MTICTASNIAQLAHIHRMALRCYTCAGTCPNVLSHTHEVECPNSTLGCFKYILNNDGRHMTHRGCAQRELCDKIAHVPHTRLYSCAVCDTDLCNTAHHISTNSTNLLFTFLFILIRYIL